MELDTNFYYVSEKKVHNPKTKETLFTTTRNGECSYFRKNYCLMEWFSKHWNIDIENCTDYLVDKDDIIALIKDCQLAIDLVDDAVNGRDVDFDDSLEELSEDVQSQLVKLFPYNGWRFGKVKFDGDDYNDVKDIIRQFETTYWENTDKLIFTNWW